MNNSDKRVVVFYDGSNDGGGVGDGDDANIVPRPDIVQDELC